MVALGVRWRAAGRGAGLRTGRRGGPCAHRGAAVGASERATAREPECGAFAAPGHYSQGAGRLRAKGSPGRSREGGAYLPEGGATERAGLPDLSCESLRLGGSRWSAQHGLGVGTGNLFRIPPAPPLPMAGQAGGVAQAAFLSTLSPTLIPGSGAPPG